jgi:uncharacterized membrane protein
VVGVVGLICTTIFVALPTTKEKLVWNRQSIGYFAVGGAFESLGLLLVLYALTYGPVVVVTPLTATLPLWVVLGSKLFLRDLEKITPRIVAGAALVVAGTIAISLEEMSRVPTAKMLTAPFTQANGPFCGRYPLIGLPRECGPSWQLSIASQWTQAGGRARHLTQKVENCSDAFRRVGMVHYNLSGQNRSCPGWFCPPNAHPSGTPPPTVAWRAADYK